MMQHYYAIAEAGDDGSWWISFPGRDGIISAAYDARQLVAQAQDALGSAAMYGGRLPPAIEDGALPSTDLSNFRAPAMVVVIPFEVLAPMPSTVARPPRRTTPREKTRKGVTKTKGK
jgi:hypothetical protein